MMTWSNTFHLTEIGNFSLAWWTNVKTKGKMKRYCILAERLCNVIMVMFYAVVWEYVEVIRSMTGGVWRNIFANPTLPFTLKMVSKDIKGNTWMWTSAGNTRIDWLMEMLWDGKQVRGESNLEQKKSTPNGLQQLYWSVHGRKWDGDWNEKEGNAEGDGGEGWREGGGRRG